MKGWQIFSHSLGLVFSNLDVAFRVSAVLYSVYALVLMLLLQGNMPVMSGTGELIDRTTGLPIVDGQVMTSAFVVVVVQVFISIWIAIAWHRFVLLNERPAGLMPNWPGGNVLSYFGWSILIGIIVGVASIPVAFVVGLMGIALPALLVLLPIVMVVTAIVVFYRLAPVLPGIAVGKKITLRESWEKTTGDIGAILAMALFVMVLGLLTELPTMIGGASGSFISVIYDLVITWFSILIGSSVLTTLYGHYIEGRELD